MTISTVSGRAGLPDVQSVRRSSSGPSAIDLRAVSKRYAGQNGILALDTSL